MATIKMNLGQQVNLVHGLRQDVNAPFFTLQKEGARLPLQPLPSPAAATSTASSLTLCTTWSDLLAAYYSSFSIPACCCSNKVRNASAFVLQPGTEAAAQKAVADHLGIPMKYASDGANTSFALVRLTKTTAKATFDTKAAGVSEAKLQVVAALSKLPAQADPATSIDAVPYLDFFQSHGTHYVSEVQLGDVALQAFVFHRDVLDNIKAQAPEYDVAGSITDATTVALFRTYTQMEHAVVGGFTLAATPVVTASRSTAFQANILPKLEDTKTGLAASIFALSSNKDLQGQFRQLSDVAPIGVKLTDLTSFLDQVSAGQPSVQAPFCNLLDAAVLQKFGVGATHTAKREALIGQQPDYAALYKTTLPELATTAATEVVAISQMYFRLDTIHKKRLLYANETKEVQVFSDVIEIQNSLELPGDKVTLISRLLVAAPAASSKDAKYAVVTLSSKAAFDTFRPIAQKVLGTVAIEGPAGSGLRRTLYNGTSLVNKASGTGSDAPVDVVLEAALNDTYIASDQLANYNVQLGIQTTLLVAENVLSYRFNNTLVDAALQYAGWLRTSLKLFASPDEASALQLSDDVTMDLAKAYTRASLLVTAPVDGRNALSVPRLTYSQYETAIQRMTESAQAYADALLQSSVMININKAQEATNELVNSLNKNVQAIGQFLLKQNEVQTDKERDVTNYNNKVMEKQQASINDCNNKNDELLAQMKAQMQAVDTAKKAMQTGIRRATDMAIMEVVMGAVGAVFSILGGGFFAAGANFDPNVLSKTQILLQKTANIMRVLESISRTWAQFSAVGGPVMSLIKINQTLSSLGGMSELKKAPTELDWNNFDAEVAGMAGPIIGTVPEVGLWLNETKKMSNIGRAITANAANLAKLQYDLLLQGWQKDASDKQVNRLQWLQTQLQQPNLPKAAAMQINLFELGTLLEARANRATLMLLRTLALQDAALQYAYFQEPAQIAKAASLNIHDVHDLLVAQTANTLTALSGLPAPSDLPNPISFVLPAVPVSTLTTDRNYEFSIPTDSPAIPTFYKRVRINYIEVQFTGAAKPSTTSGELVVILNSSTQFSDRAPDNTARSYTAMLPASYTYAYDLTSNATTFSNKPSTDFQGRFMSMTPFTKWTLSLPPTGQNNGLDFPKGALTTEITIRFYCSAIYSTAAATRAVPRALALNTAISSHAAASARGLSAVPHSIAGTRNFATRDAPPPAATGGFSASFDTTASFDNWVPDDGSQAQYSVDFKLGPLLPKFEILDTKVHVTGLLSAGRLHPIPPPGSATAGPPDVVLPPGYFRLDATFDCIPDGMGGLGFQYNYGSSIKIVEANPGWKTEKTGSGPKAALRWPDQAAVERARALVEKAVEYYYTKTRAGGRVLVQAAPQDMVGIMTGKSVMRGWDVICAMDADKISKLLEEKWHAEYDDWLKDPEKHDKVKDSTVFKISTPPQALTTDLDDGNGGTFDIMIQAEATLAAPLISFVSNQPGQCTFTMPILDGKTITTYSNNPGVPVSTRKLSSSAAAVTGIVNLSVLQGIVDYKSNDSGHGVYIELDKSAFQINADIPNLQNAALGLAIKSFFTDKMVNKRIFLGAAKISNRTIPSLTPKYFRMTTVRPDLAGPGVLYMFIATNGTENDASNLGIDGLHSPLMQGHSASLFINSRILFQDLLFEQVRSAFYKDGLDRNWCEVVRKPDNTTQPYCIQGRETSVKVGHLTVYNFPPPLDTSRASSDVMLPLKDIVIKGTGTQIDTIWDYDFPVAVPFCVFACSTETHGFHIKVPFKPLKPTVDPVSQIVSLGSWGKAGNTEISGPGVAWYDSLSGKADMVGAVNNWFRGKFNDVNIQLPDAFVAAVSNLLFPNHQILDYQTVYTPGDLLVVGDVKDSLAAATRDVSASALHTAAMRGLPPVPAAAAPMALSHGPRSAKARALEPLTVNGSSPPTIAASNGLSVHSNQANNPAAATATPNTQVDPAPLLSQLSSHAAIDPWTLALALPTDQLNSTLAKSPPPFPSPLTPASVVINSDPVVVTTTLSVTLSYPTLSLIPGDASRVQLKVPITSGTVTQDTQLDAETSLPSKERAVSEGSYVTFSASLKGTDSAGIYTVAADLTTAEVSELFVGTKVVSDIVAAGLKDNIAARLQATKLQLPVASLFLPSATSADLPHVDTFTFAIVSRGKDAMEGSGAIVLAAGSTARLGSGQPPLGLAGLQGLPLAAGSRACMYVAHSVLMESLLLPAVREAGATAEAASLLAAAALQKPTSPGLLSTITGGPTKFPIYKVSDHPTASDIDVDVSVDLSGLTFALDGNTTLHGDSLSVSWQQTWTQAIKYKDHRGHDQSDLLQFRFALSAAPVGGATIKLVYTSDGAELQFPPVKLATPVVDFELSDGGLFTSAKMAAAKAVAARVKEVLSSLTLHGFNASGPALSMANYVMNAAVGNGIMRRAQAFVPADLVLVAP